MTGSVSVKSRVLMSLADDEPGHADSKTSFCLRDIVSNWWRLLEMRDTASPDMHTERNETGSDEQALMHPDIAVMTLAPAVNTTH